MLPSLAVSTNATTAKDQSLHFQTVANPSPSHFYSDKHGDIISQQPRVVVKRQAGRQNKGTGRPLDRYRDIDISTQMEAMMPSNQLAQKNNDLRNFQSLRISAEEFGSKRNLLMQAQKRSPFDKKNQVNDVAKSTKDLLGAKSTSQMKSLTKQDFSALVLPRNKSKQAMLEHLEQNLQTKTDLRDEGQARPLQQSASDQLDDDQKLAVGPSFSQISSVRKSVDLGGQINYGSLFGGPETNKRLMQIKKRSRQYLRKLYDPRKQQLSALSRLQLQGVTSQNSLVQSPTHASEAPSDTASYMQNKKQPSLNQSMQKLRVSTTVRPTPAAAPSVTDSSNRFNVVLSPRTGLEAAREAQNQSSLMTIFDDQKYWNKKQAPHVQLMAHEKDRQQGRLIAKHEVQSLPKIRSRAKLPEDQLRSLPKMAKREMIAKFQEELDVTLYKPEPPKTKQVDIDLRLTHYNARIQQSTLHSREADKSPITKFIQTNASNPAFPELSQTKQKLIERQEKGADGAQESDDDDASVTFDHLEGTREQFKTVSEMQVSNETIKTITKEQLEDPLAFDMSKVLVFKMPKVTSKVMYDKVDEQNPRVQFKDSKYYREKRHLGGLMGKESLKQLKKQIKDMGEHRRDVHELSPNPETRKNQVSAMIERMDDAVEASRLEQLLLRDHASDRRQLEHTFSKLKLTAKGEKRLQDLLNKRFA